MPFSTHTVRLTQIRVINHLFPYFFVFGPLSFFLPVGLHKIYNRDVVTCQTLDSSNMLSRLFSQSVSNGEVRFAIE